MYFKIHNVIHYIPIREVVNLSGTKPLSRSSQQNNISLELAITTLLNASIDEISEVLKEIPPEKMGKIAIAIGQVWQEASD